MKSLNSSREILESLPQPDLVTVSPPWRAKCLWGKMNSNSFRIELPGNAVSWVNSLSCLFYWLQPLESGSPLGSGLVSSSAVSINTEMESKCLTEEVWHRNSCCFVTFRASCAPVPEEGRLLKEVNTLWLHCQDCFCPKASAAFRQKGPSLRLGVWCEREQLQNLSVICRLHC